MTHLSLVRDSEPDPLPKVGWIGTGEVFLTASSRWVDGQPEAIYHTVKVGNVWSCSCPARGECRHIRSAQEVLREV